MYITNAQLLHEHSHLLAYSRNYYLLNVFSNFFPILLLHLLEDCALVQGIKRQKSIERTKRKNEIEMEKSQRFDNAFGKYGVDLRQ